MTSSGVRSLSASSAARVIASPTPLPMLPPMKAKSIAATTTGCPPIVAGPEDGAFAAPGLPLSLDEPLRVRLRVGEGEHVERLEIAAQVDEAALVQQLLESLPDRQAEVVVALGADAEVAPQALVVDERVAGRTLRPLQPRRLPSAGRRSGGKDLEVQSTVLGSGRRKGLLRSARGRRRPVALAEDLGDDERQDVGRPAEPVETRGVDGEVEGATPVLAPDLGLDHAVVGDRPRGRRRRRGCAATEGLGGLVEAGPSSRQSSPTSRAATTSSARCSLRRDGWSASSRRPSRRWTSTSPRSLSLAGSVSTACSRYLTASSASGRRTRVRGRRALECRPAAARPSGERHRRPPRDDPPRPTRRRARARRLRRRRRGPRPVPDSRRRREVLARGSTSLQPAAGRDRPDDRRAPRGRFAVPWKSPAS